MPVSIQLRGDHITLANALKVAGAAESGGQAKIKVREGDVRVNGEMETKPGRKLRAGDRLAIGDQEWVIEA
ncbi:MAG: RNA-binding S4 domain-containing protein [Planctomycetes bacterium]|nr:RNA-binding S4 domain-containing protein [Planctomycetota bacterium]